MVILGWTPSVIDVHGYNVYLDGRKILQNIFGEVTMAAMMKEFKQIDEREVPGKPVMTPTDPDILTQDKKNNYLMQ